MSEQTQVAVRDAAEVLPRRDPMQSLLKAIDDGKDLDTIKTLMDLQERWEKREARKAFDRAIADAKAEIGVIEKNKHVGFDSKKAGAAKTDYWHEDLAEIARTIDPILGKYGLSYRFRPHVAANEPVTVTCILAHRDGHIEESSLQAGRDDTGNKNSIQQVGSTITYLQRYTLKAALGLAAGRDDDGKASEAPPENISPEQAAALRTRLNALGEKVTTGLLRHFNIEKIEDLPARDYNEANRELDEVQTVRERRAREQAHV